jgi:TPR repeat protein
MPVSDICSETAWCYLNAIGTKKNIKKAARYYRMAEKQGVKSVGLSWIWKDKYNETEDRHMSSVGQLHGEETSQKGKKLFGRNNSA